MKKILILILAVMLLIPAALAEDLSSLSDEELLKLHSRVSDELERRFLFFSTEATSEASFSDATASFCAFMKYWTLSDYQSMLFFCSSDWKNRMENPEAELFRILAYRTPVTCEILDLSGNSRDTERVLTANVSIDRNNGRGVRSYLIEVIMKREEDGLWYVDPRSLQSHEEDVADPDPTPVPAEADADDILLYFNAENGQKYHLDPNCKTVHPNYLPLTDSFPFAEVCDPKYADLQPCMICGAPVRPEAVSSAE